MWEGLGVEGRGGKGKGQRTRSVAGEEVRGRGGNNQHHHCWICCWLAAWVRTDTQTLTSENSMFPVSLRSLADITIIMILINLKKT